MILKLFIESKNIKQKQFSVFWKLINSSFFKPIKYGKTEPFKNIYDSSVTTPKNRTV